MSRREQFLKFHQGSERKTTRGFININTPKTFWSPP